MIRNMALGLAGVLVFGSAAQAALTVSGDAQDAGAPGLLTFTPTYTVPSGDLLAGLTASNPAGSFDLESSGGLPVLNDLSYGTILNSGQGAHPAFATTGNNGGTSVTYNLASASNVSKIIVLGGWNDNGRDAQNYSVSYTTTSNPSFTQLDLTGATPSGIASVVGNNVAFDTSVAAGTQSADQSIISDSGGANILTNVTAIQFNFGSVENGYTGTAELAVIGTSAATPEPASLGLLGAGALGLLARRRRA